MRIFISWSGARSRRVAEALRDWLPMIFQSATPWVSSTDIQAGSRWAREVSSVLEESDFGVICLTETNLLSPWILFEAGALSKSMLAGRVVPYLIDLDPMNLTGPLSQFQAVKADRDGTRFLLDSIATAVPSNQRPQDALGRLFSMVWPELEKSLKEARSIVEVPAAESGRRSPTVIQLAEQLRSAASRELEVPAEDIERARGLMSEYNAGMVKLIGSPGQLEDAGINGGGAYFDFVRRDQRYGYGSDIGLVSGYLKTGFAGANYGFILRLGPLDAAAVFSATADTAPTNLPNELHDGWKFMWNYRPPRELKEIRKHQREARNKVVGGTPVSETAASQVGAVYLLRSIQTDDHDVLVAFRIEREMSDRSLILLWRILQIFETPVASGRDEP